MSFMHNSFCFTNMRIFELVVAIIFILYIISFITGNSVKISTQIAKSVAAMISTVREAFKALMVYQRQSHLISRTHFK